MLGSDELAFLSLIAAHPADDQPRLIYADWLDDQGDPRGGFIRVQCALARLSPDDPRRPALEETQREYLEAFEQQWAAPVRDLVEAWEFRRGLLECIVLDAGDFLKVGGEVFRRVPTLRRVRLTNAELWIGRVGQCEHLERVRELDVCGNDLGNGGVNVLARSPWLGRLEGLDLSFNIIGTSGIAALAQSSRLGSLTELAINDNARIGLDGMRSLANSPVLRGLTRLDVSNCDLNDEAIRLLVASPISARLSSVELHGNHIGDAGVATLLNSAMCERMIRRAPLLDLRAGAISPVGAVVLTQAAIVRDATVLDLSGNYLGDRGCTALAAATNFVSLRVLRLRHNDIGDLGILALTDAPWLGQLEDLDLRGNPITEDALQLLNRSPHYSWRTRVEGTALFRSNRPRWLEAQRRPLA